MSAITSRVLARPLSYRLWQGPFVATKFAPVRAGADLGSVRRVLDVGCGPGTNTKYFAANDYVGIDVNQRYIDYARRRHGREFLVADATEFTVPAGERFDFVLLNSFLHHIDDGSVRRLLAHLSTVLTADGHIHVIELVLPERRSIARRLAEMDRGEHPRSLPRWRELLAESFEPVAFDPFPVGRARWGGPTLWEMVYFKGSPR